MKTFIDILNESKKVYPFKIGVAGELPQEFSDKLETALQKFGVSNLTNGKKTPIQERPLDFPQLHNTEVTYFETDLSYPTTPQVLRSYLASICDVHESYITVRRPNEPLEMYQEEFANHSKQEEYETLLTQQDMGGESAQHNVGDNRVMDLLKELETARKEREHDPAAAAPVGDSKDIANNANSKSPIGS
jgi:hypothetical protein